MNKILVVDDTKAFCTMVKYMLKNHGYEVLVAGDGEEALRILREQDGHF